MRKALTIQQVGSKGGKAYVKNHTKAQRSANARRASKARWDKYRAVRKAKMHNYALSAAVETIGLPAKSKWLAKRREAQS